MTTSKGYDNLNRLTSIGSSNATPAVLDFHGYGYNSANQRTSVTNTDGSYWVYAYDSLGQVTSGIRYWSNGTPVPGQQFGYAFDTIGNRTSTQAGGDQNGVNLRSATYTANNLNQYSSRTVPAYINVLGTANSNATVSLNITPTYRKGTYYRDELPVTNSSAPVYLSVTNLAVLNNGTNADIVTNVTGNVFLPQTPESYTYDTDGNLMQDGRWTYTWDGENRLINMTSLSSGPSASKLKLDFAYDFQGRRIQKLVSTWNGSTYVAASTNRFAYDAWNLSAILNPDSSVQSSFVWGLDLSGTLQGAGGVGGLLKVNSQGTNAFVCFDGNGNVTALVDASSSTITGQYEYGPFGETLRATGPMAKANPVRFSAKYQDVETDFLYFGYRYYSPMLGVWLSRDPLVERGSKNLYSYCGNNVANSFDPDGRITVTTLKKDYGDCGGWNVTFKFLLDQPAPSDGYLVQMVTEADDVKDCKGNVLLKNTTVFWEAWPIKKGDAQNNITARGPYTDHSSHQDMKGRGTASATGVLKFFGRDVTGDLGDIGQPLPTTPPLLPPTWGTGKGGPPGAGPSGDLPSTTVTPDWWNDPKRPPIEGPAGRSVSETWDCCCSVVPVQFSVTP